MPKHSNPYTIVFVSVIAIVCSLILSLSATGLKPFQQANQRLYIRKNILKAFNEYDPHQNPEHPERNMSDKQVQEFFEDRVVGRVVDGQGNVLPDETVDQINPEEEDDKPLESRRLPLYVLNDEGGQPIAYGIPIIGKGLWSTLYGYLTLEDDLNTVRGITFYKHGETPGLGAEIEKDWFQNNFKGKKILDQGGDLVSVSVVKGHAAEQYSGEKLTHYVDGISGATITSRGVTKMLADDLASYEPYFSKLREGVSPDGN